MMYRSIKPILVDAVQVKEPSDIPTPGGVLHLQPGDWPVRDPQGNQTRYKDIDFKSTYEILSRSIPLEELHEAKPCGC